MPKINEKDAQTGIISRRDFLSTAAAGAAVSSLATTSVPKLAQANPVDKSGQVTAQGSEEIPFYKHTIDLEQSEAAAVADVNQDGKLDIISGENWYEQTTPGENGPRWIKHHFRNLGFYRFTGKYQGA